MNPSEGDTSDRLPPADLDFFRIFLPYEILLAQRRAMVWGAASDEELPNAFLGIFLLRLRVATGGQFPNLEEGGEEIGEHVQSLLRMVLRDSDIAGKLSDGEHLAILRDLSAHQAYVVAQRLLTATTRSEVLDAANLHARVGYVVYPLSPQPNFPARQWSTLVELARRVADRDSPAGRASGFGVLRGPRVTEASIPEADLVPLVFQDPESLVKAGVLRLQRIHLLPST
jgi:hypothetical protein